MKLFESIELAAIAVWHRIKLFFTPVKCKVHTELTDGYKTKAQVQQAAAELHALKMAMGQSLEAFEAISKQVLLGAYDEQLGLAPEAAAELNEKLLEVSVQNKKKIEQRSASQLHDQRGRVWISSQNQR